MVETFNGIGGKISASRLVCQQYRAEDSPVSVSADLSVDLLIVHRLFSLNDCSSSLGETGMMHIRSISAQY